MSGNNKKAAGVYACCRRLGTIKEFRAEAGVAQLGSSGFSPAGPNEGYSLYNPPELDSRSKALNAEVLNVLQQFWKDHFGIDFIYHP